MTSLGYAQLLLIYAFMHFSVSKMAVQGNGWEDLSKLARKLEAEVDFKLSAFSKLGSSYGNHDKNEKEDSVPLLSGSKSEHVFDTMSLEIEQLLEKLSGVNSKMADYVEIQGKINPSSSLSHNIQRHRSILQDYYRDFHKTKTNIQGLKEREDLFRITKDNERTLSSGLTRRSELYMKENEHLRSSDRLVDDQINIALETKEHMINQRAAFKAIQGKLNTLANRFPAVNSLIQRINFRKRRDSIIIGLVIGVCLILMLMYIFH